jgi:4-oxalocrotonate tautomerase
MPHVIVKLWPGKSEKQKQEMTDKIVAAVTSTLGYGDESVSVALEEISASDWKEQVYGPDILEAEEGALYKKPGYQM